jgi:predicted NACHT family NTPase
VGHSARVVACCFSPDGTRIASAGYDHAVRLWVVGTGECVRTLQGHTNWVLSARFSVDDGGARIATASWDNTARVWDAASGACLRTLRHQNTVNDAIFSPDGTRVATAPYDGALKIWDAATASCVATLPGHEAPVNMLAYAKDGTLASASDDGTARVWGYPPLYRWLAGLRLEAYYDALVARGHRYLEHCEHVTEGELDAVAMSGDEASRFLDYVPLLRSNGYALPAREPVEDLRAFVALFVGAAGARSLATGRVGTIGAPETSKTS